MSSQHAGGALFNHARGGATLLCWLSLPARCCNKRHHKPKIDHICRTGNLMCSQSARWTKAFNPSSITHYHRLACSQFLFRIASCSLIQIISCLSCLSNITLHRWTPELALDVGLGILMPHNYFASSGLKPYNMHAVGATETLGFYSRQADFGPDMALLGPLVCSEPPRAGLCSPHAR